MRRRPDERVFTFTRTGDRGRLGEPIDVEGCCLRRRLWPSNPMRAWYVALAELSMYRLSRVA